MENMKFTPRISTNFDASTQEKEYIKNLANEYFLIENEEKKKLISTGAVIKRRKDIQQKFKKAVGILPDRNAPLNIKICNEHTLPEGVILRNLTYETLPGIKVTGTLYLPKNYDSLGSLPAVVVPCGHSPVGRAHDTYSTLSRMLARNSIVALCVDPPGQHERVQYPDKNGKSRIGGAVAEHFQIGFPCHLTGLTLAAFFVRDLERAIDILEELPFIDNSRIGISGCSGGGLMTSYMTLWDDRLAAAAPSCFITTRLASLLNGRPVDPEQIVPGVIQEGINHDDFMALFAPKPHLICVAQSDPVDIGGAIHTHNIARSIYSLFDAEENARLTIAPTGHMLSEYHRREITLFMSEVLKAPIDTVDETQPEPVSPELLKCTKTGSILTDEPDSRSLFDYYNDYIKTNRYKDCDRTELRSRVLEFLKTPEDMKNRPPVLYPRYLFSGEISEGINGKKIWFFSEGESDFSPYAKKIAVCGNLYEPEGAGECVILVSDDEDTQYVEKLLKENKSVFQFFPRGIGALKSLDAPNITIIKSSVGSILSPEYRRGCDAAMCGTSVAALRTYDTLRAYDYIRDHYENISFAGEGFSSLYALLAASITETCAEVFDEPISYEKLVNDYEYQRNEREEVFGILKYFDIPFLAEKLKKGSAL